LLDVRDAGFLWRELQAPVAQELLDQWPDFIFQHVLGRAGDDEVVRIPNEVYLWADGFSVRILPGEVLLQEWFQSVQSQVGQCGRDNPALWCACLGGKQGSIFHEARLEPFVQHFLVRGNMGEQPFVTDLGTFLRQAVLHQAVRHWTLTTLREKLIKIGAKVVLHSRKIVFQMAEVAVPRELFQTILERIGRLRSATAMSG